MKSVSDKSTSIYLAVAVGAVGFTFFVGYFTGSATPPPPTNQPVQPVQPVQPAQTAQAVLAVIKANRSFNHASNTSHHRPQKSALEELVSQEDPLQKNLDFSQFLSSVTSKNVRGHWIDLAEKSNGTQEDRRRLALLGYTWGTLHGDEAVQFALSHDSPENIQLATHAIEGWAADSPKAAANFMRSDEGLKSKGCRLGFLKGLARSDPQAAVSYILVLEEFTDARPYLKPVLKSQLQKSFEVAEQWVLSLPSDRLIEQGMQGLAREITKKTPEEAIDWLDTFSDRPFAAAAISKVASHYMSATNSDADREFVLKWLHELPEGEAKNAAYHSSLRSWTKRAPKAAAEHLNTLPQSLAKDHAVRAYSMETTKKFPDIAVQWATSIVDPELRQSTLITTSRAWIRIDPVAATQWIETSGMAEQTLLAIQNP